MERERQTADESAATGEAHGDFRNILAQLVTEMWRVQERLAGLERREAPSVVLPTGGNNQGELQES